MHGLGAIYGFPEPPGPVMKSIHLSRARRLLNQEALGAGFGAGACVTSYVMTVATFGTFSAIKHKVTDKSVIHIH